MARVVVSLLAQADTAIIPGDLAEKAGRRVAAEYAAAFEAVYERLAAHPDSGPPRSALGRDIRIGVVSLYIIIYGRTEANDTVTIFRVVHGRRRITGKLLRRG